MSFLANLEQGALDVLKAAGLAVESFVISETQKAVAMAKQTDLGTLALNLVSAFSNHDMSGPAKMTAVVGALVPAVESFVAKGGLPGLEASALDFAKELGQSVFNDFAATVAKVSHTS